MSDSKTAYSEVSHYYVEVLAARHEADRLIYERSKKREAKYNDEWQKQPVNINEICDRFAPGDSGHAVKGKYIFEGPQYNVVADMPAGYLRIYDKVNGCYVLLDGSRDTKSMGHYKILKREEM